MPKERRFDVFLSYSVADKSWVPEFASALRSAGRRPWFDASEISPGERWMELIQEALRESRILVVILSEKSVQSPWISFEVGAAYAGKKMIIPVLIGGLEPTRIPMPLAMFQFVQEPSPVDAGRRVAEVLTAQRGES